MKWCLFSVGAVEFLWGPEAERHLFFRPLLSSAISRPSPCSPSTLTRIRKVLALPARSRLRPLPHTFRAPYLSSFPLVSFCSASFAFFLLVCDCALQFMGRFFSLSSTTRRIISSFTPFKSGLPIVFQPSFPTCSFSLFCRVVSPIDLASGFSAGHETNTHYTPFDT